MKPRTHWLRPCTGRCNAHPVSSEKYPPTSPHGGTYPSTSPYLILSRSNFSSMGSAANQGNSHVAAAWTQSMGNPVMQQVRMTLQPNRVGQVRDKHKSQGQRTPEIAAPVFRRQGRVRERHFLRPRRTPAEEERPPAAPVQVAAPRRRRRSRPPLSQSLG